MNPSWSYPWSWPMHYTCQSLLHSWQRIVQQPRSSWWLSDHHKGCSKLPMVHIFHFHHRSTPLLAVYKVLDMALNFSKLLQSLFRVRCSYRSLASSQGMMALLFWPIMISRSLAWKPFRRDSKPDRGKQLPPQPVWLNLLVRSHLWMQFWYHLIYPITLPLVRARQ